MTTFNGGTGNDTFNGSAGNDSANGNDGYDTLTGNGGADTLDGGADNDILYSDVASGYYNRPYFSYDYTAPLLDHDTAVDTLRGGAGDDLISAGYGDNVDGGDGSDVLLISFQGATSGVVFDMTLSSQVIGGGTIKNIESLGWLEGSQYNDTITDGGGSGGNFVPLFGMGGNDSIIASYYTGNIYGGDGDDTIDARGAAYGFPIYGEAGNDTIYAAGSAVDGGEGDDLIYGYGLINGGAGADSLVLSGEAAAHGDDGNDDLTASDADQTLYGDAGDDILRGGDGNNILSGGAGNDTITGGGQRELNPWEDGSAGDTVAYSGKSTDYQVSEDAVSHLITVTDMRDGSPDGTDVLDRTIELMRFSDGTYLLDNVIAGVGLGVTTLVGGDGDDLFVGSEDGNAAQGNGGNDTLNGNGGGDTLEGGAGTDTLDGGTGGDVLYSAAATGYYTRPYFGNPYSVPILDRGTEVDTLRGGSGDDVLSAGYGDNVDGGEGENVLLISFQGATSGVTFDLSIPTQVIGGGTIQNISNAAWIEGSEYNDTLTDGGSFGNFAPIFGMGGNDSLVSGYYTGDLFGGAGNDTLDSHGSGYGFLLHGGTGDDVYLGGGQIVEEANEGTDTVISEYNVLQLAANVENLTLTGAWATQGTGNALGNLITGNGQDNMLSGFDGADRLVGGIGNDTLVGGAGNDTLFVEGADDVVVELTGEGTDLVYSYISYTLGDNVERLALAGKAALDGTGNALDNIITGNALANHLTGLDGNDRLDGGAGNDTMAGGSGNDTYVWTDGDVLVEQPGEGTDTIIASSDFVLTGSFENLTLTGTALLGSGTDADNILTGNDQNNILKGFGGNDSLIGGLGKDALYGGTGNDSYWVEAGDFIRELAGQGKDVVYASTSFQLGAGQEIETLILTGKDNTGATGNGLNNTLTGNAGNNRLNGGVGADTMDGGFGSDTYVVDNSGDVVTDSGNGVDLVYASVDFHLSAQVDNLTLTGGDALGAWGNDHGNRLTGNGGNNIIAGGGGADTMVGGAGDDTYYVDTIIDRIGELAGQGTDVVYTSVSYGLSAWVEDLYLTGSGYANAAGNALANHIEGNEGVNRINGGAGNDTLSGGHGADTFIFAAGSGADIIRDFSAAEGDLIHLRAYSNKVAFGSGITITQVGGDVLIDMGGGNTITVEHTLTTDLTAHIVW